MADIFIQQANTDLYDEYFSYWREYSLPFAQVSKVQKDALPSISNLKAEFRVRMDSKQVIYGRVADTIFSALESIGGFMESLMHIGMLLVFFFQERLFKSSFIR